MKLKQFISKHRPFIEDILTKKLDEKIEDTKILRGFPSEYRMLKQFVTKGKMLRGIFVVLGHSMYSGKSVNEAYKTAAALELIHSSLLIHDDIMDDDTLRRGEKTIFGKYKDFAEDTQRKTPHFYGHGMAICAGDIAFFLATEIISDTRKNNSSQILKIISEEIQRVGVAQMQDFDLGKNHYEPNHNEIINMYIYKSARYTFSLPLVIGATIAGASKDQINYLDKFGERLGVVFQIKDDELGLFEDQEKIGKPKASDIKENKKTLFRALLLENIPENEATKLKKSFRKDVTKEELQEIYDYFEKYKVRTFANEITSKITHEARTLLEDCSTDKKYKTILEELIEYNLERKK